MTQTMELIERIERIRELNPLDAAEELIQSPSDDVQFILSRLPAEQAQMIVSHPAKPSDALSFIMVLEPFAFQEDTPVKEAVSEVLYRHYRMYPVVDEQRHVLGALNGAAVGVIAGIAMFAYAQSIDSANPATASSIFLTTFTDIIGMGLMLFLATSLVL